GTNDLTQYALAIDRGHKELSPYADSLHPAVLKLIEATVKGAAKFNKPVGVCGAMASDMESIPILLGLGIRDLSVVSSLIPDIKAFIRSLDWKKCAAKARLALAMEEASQVREMIKTEFKI
ncbi:MAG: phosphoenolpyruvate--protein phosphotransferase, partial [Elusimicrobiota bacterium]|nr:phosphoenolpyruvate--protein phosphotransferase [Elusimicrobiota bacterium]